MCYLGHSLSILLMALGILAGKLYSRVGFRSRITELPQYSVNTVMNEAMSRRSHYPTRTVNLLQCSYNFPQIVVCTRSLSYSTACMTKRQDPCTQSLIFERKALFSAAWVLYLDWYQNELTYSFQNPPESDEEEMHCPILFNLRRRTQGRQIRIDQWYGSVSIYDSMNSPTDRPPEPNQLLGIVADDNTSSSYRQFPNTQDPFKFSNNPRRRNDPESHKKTVQKAAELGERSKQPRLDTAKIWKESGKSKATSPLEIFQNNGRKWKTGDVYAPHDLSSVEMKRWMYKRPGTTDAFDVLGIDPSTQYKVSGSVL